jgi:hypothetical protein
MRVSIRSLTWSIGGGANRPFPNSHRSTSIPPTPTPISSLNGTTQRAASTSLSSSSSSSSDNRAVGVKPKRISLEGNIAAGKSTFLALLQKEQLDFAVMQEPVTRWQRILPSPVNGNAAAPTNTSTSDAAEDSVPGGNLLDMFYRDPSMFTTLSIQYKLYALVG